VHEAVGDPCSPAWAVLEGLAACIARNREVVGRFGLAGWRLRQPQRPAWQEPSASAPCAWEWQPERPTHLCVLADLASAIITLMPRVLNQGTCGQPKEASVHRQSPQEPRWSTVPSDRPQSGAINVSHIQWWSGKSQPRAHQKPLPNSWQSKKIYCSCTPPSGPSLDWFPL